VNDLPVDAVLPELHRALREGPVVLEAPTGAGKSTRVPPSLLSQTSGEIWVIEPRRVAARAVAERIAEELGEPLGQTIGLHVRFQRKGSKVTRLWVMTDGMLLRRLQENPYLEGVGAVVFDEFHERRVAVDLGLALVSQLRELRDDLHLIAMSATLDAGALADWLGASRVRSEGRTYPVEIVWHGRQGELATDVAAAVDRAWADTSGDVLVFLPGTREIRDATEALAHRTTVPLHGRLSVDDQSRALRPGRGRRVILATNVAETSVTPPGVAAVVDTGLARVARQDRASGLDRLSLEPIAQANADQRAGRAGRVGPGVCYRLWTPREHSARAAFTEAEIHRVSLAGPLLQLHDLDEPDPLAFPWFDAPAADRVARAEGLLQDLGLLEDGHLTADGRVASGIPAAPRLARLLMDVARAGHPEDAALAVALLTERDPFPRQRPRHDSGSDLFDRVEGLQGRGPLTPSHSARSIRRVAKQLRRTAPRSTHRLPLEEALARACLAAFPDRVAKRRDRAEYARLVGGRGVRIAAWSAVRTAPWFVALRVDRGAEGSREGRVDLASEMNPSWLRTEERVQARWDEERQRVVGEEVVAYRDLVLKRREGAAVPDDTVSRALADVPAARWLPEEATPLVRRIAFLRRQGFDFPDPTPEWCRDAIVPYLQGARTLKAIQRLPWAKALRDALPWPLPKQLDELAPLAITVPSGRQRKLDYPDDGPPVLAVKMQEMFGARETPTVAGGRVPVLCHLLAPNGRPAQVTSDLASFWDNTWSEVRKELRQRYPKHPWPEDPRSAQATWRTNRRK